MNICVFVRAFVLALTFPAICIRIHLIDILSGIYSHIFIFMRNGLMESNPPTFDNPDDSGGSR